MATPALFVTILFSLWLLKRELRRRPSLSPAVWIPTFFMMILASRSVSDWLAGGNAGDNVGSSLSDELFYVLVLGASFIIASSRRVKWGRFFSANLPLMLIYVYFVFSIIWSDNPFDSAKRIVKDFGMLFVIALIFSEREPLQAIRAVFVRSACVLFPLSLVFDRFFPRFAREYSNNGTMLLSGVTGQKNSLGEMVFIFCGMLLWDYLEIRETGPRSRALKRMPWDQLLLFAMGMVLLVQSQSKTALISLVILCVLSLRKGALASKAVSTVAFSIALSTPFLLFTSREFEDLIQPIVKALGRDLTFTGRTEIWAYINWDTVNPIIGCGFWNFWRGPKGLAISADHRWSIPTAHCGYLDLYLDGGVCALVVLFCVLVAYGLRLIKRSQADRFHRVGLGMLCAAIVYNLSESSFLRIGPLWFTTLLMMVDFPMLKQTKERSLSANEKGTVARSARAEAQPAGWAAAR